MIGAAAMSLSSFCVVMNALRLNFAKVADNQGAAVNDEEIKTDIKESKQMEKVMKIEGMMCPHCEARVKKCLEALPEVTEAKVSHKDGTAIVVLASDVSDDVLKKTVEDQGYTVL
jgi:Cu2+-exporting ATPase